MGNMPVQVWRESWAAMRREPVSRACEYAASISSSAQLPVGRPSR